MAAVVGTVSSSSIKQICSTTIASLLSQYFSTTLNKETDIVKLIMAQIQAESSFNYNAAGPVLSVTTSSGAADYYYSGAIANIESTGSPVQRSNVIQGQQALGLMQTMGWNQVKGASRATGKQLIEQARPDLVSILCVNPGDNLYAKFTGSATISNQILAGLAILEQKYKSVKQSGSTYTIGNLSYPSKMQCAFRGYIGLASKDNGNGSSSDAYVTKIYYGSAYVSANGSSSGGGASNPSATAAAGGPNITIASGNNQHPVGC
jgi:hypothetical protein